MRRRLILPDRKRQQSTDIFSAKAAKSMRSKKTLIMNQSSQSYLRQKLADHISGGEAFTPIEALIEKIPYDKIGIVPDHLPYSLWQLLYHIRYTQLDILEFSRDPNYKAPNWPDDYWPSDTSKASKDEWEDLKRSYLRERKEFISLIKDDKIDLFKPFGHGDGQTLFREAILIIEHAAYHTGQVLILMRLLKIYK